jgi:hypothetical protein
LAGLRERDEHRCRLRRSLGRRRVDQLGSHGLGRRCRRGIARRPRPATLASLRARPVLFRHGGAITTRTLRCRGARSAGQRARAHRTRRRGPEVSLVPRPARPILGAFTHGRARAAGQGARTHRPRGRRAEVAAFAVTARRSVVRPPRTRIARAWARARPRRASIERGARTRSAGRRGCRPRGRRSGRSQRSFAERLRSRRRWWSGRCFGRRGLGARFGVGSLGRRARRGRLCCVGRVIAGARRSANDLPHPRRSFLRLLGRLVGGLLLVAHVENSLGPPWDEEASRPCAR